MTLGAIAACDFDLVGTVRAPHPFYCRTHRRYFSKVQWRHSGGAWDRDDLCDVARLEAWRERRYQLHGGDSA